MSAATKRKLAWGFVAILAIVHYDFWFWTDSSLWFGFMPVGLGFHALISLLAGVAWALVVKFAWPTWIEEWAEQDADLQDADLQAADLQAADLQDVDQQEAGDS